MKTIELNIHSDNNSFSETDKYIIASKYKKDGKWWIIESHKYSVPQKERDILAKHDFENGHIESQNDCRIFMKGLNKIHSHLTRG